MHPELALDTAILARNAAAWRAYAKASLYAVVKGDGYGWGLARVVPALEPYVDAFCVADEEELDALRRHTHMRAVLFGSVPLERLPTVLAADALPTITTREELEVTARVARARGAETRVRLALRQAIAWSGSSLDELRALVPHLRDAGASVELWTHLSAPDERDAQRERFRAAAALLSAAGVRVVSCDVASTMPLASGGPDGSAVRVGVGLFGATGGARIPGVCCALRAIAPVVRVERLRDAAPAGYGSERIEAGSEIAVARCGYADGLPRELAGRDGVLSVGMQYVTVRIERADPARGRVVLLDAGSDLDAFAASAGRLPHEIVTSFGHAAHARA